MKGKQQFGIFKAAVILVLASVLFSYSWLLYENVTPFESKTAELSSSQLGGAWGTTPGTNPVLSNETFSCEFVITYVPDYHSAWSHRNASGFYLKEDLPIETPYLWAEEHFSVGLWTEASDIFRLKVYDSSGELIKDLAGGAAIEMEIGRYVPKGERSVRFSVVVESVQSPDLCVADLRLGWSRRWFEKPYYYYGIAGMLISAVGPTLLLVLHNITQRISVKIEEK